MHALEGVDRSDDKSEDALAHYGQLLVELYLPNRGILFPFLSGRSSEIDSDSEDRIPNQFHGRGQTHSNVLSGKIGCSRNMKIRKWCSTVFDHEVHVRADFLYLCAAARKLPKR